LLFIADEEGIVLREKTSYSWPRADSESRGHGVKWVNDFWVSEWVTGDCL